MSVMIKAKPSGTQLALGIGGVEAFSFDATGVDSPVSFTATPSSNTLVVAVNPLGLRFRNPTLSSGVPVYAKSDTTLGLTVPAGASLGAVNAQSANFILLALYVSGAIELAITNQAGGIDLSETGLISTTAISSGSTSSSVIYSTTARTSVPYRVLGQITNTQATAGTYVTTPSLVQGVGGQALAAMSSFGYGQTPQTLTGSRALGTTYYNTTGRPIDFSVNCALSIGGSAFTLYVNGVARAYLAASGNMVGCTLGPVVVPPGASYQAFNNSGASLNVWTETR